MLEMNPIFPTPTWRYPVPEMRPFHDGIKAELEKLWQRGYFQQHGSGYQTREELFTPSNIENIPWIGVLKQHFTTACTEILAGRHGQSKRLPFEIYCIQGWVLIQTNEGENMAAVRPLEGHLTIFPSYLMHRPMPTPTAREWRINICMDAFVHWHKRFEDPRAKLDTSEDYAAALARSRGTS